MKKYLNYLIVVVIVIIILIMGFIIKNFLHEITSKLEVYNVLDYGASGTDQEDDSVVIQRLLDISKSKLFKKENAIVKIIIPKGNYHIKNTLRVYSNTIISLENGAVINFKGSNDILKSSYIDSNGKTCEYTDKSRIDGGLSEECNIGKYNQWDNITIEGGIWNFNKKAIITFLHGKDLKIRNLSIINPGSHAINVSGSKDVIIENVTIKNQDKTNSKKLGSLSETIHLDTTNISGEPTAFPLDGTPVKNVIIQNCSFEDVLSGIGSHVLYTNEKESGDNIIIRNNVFMNVKYVAINLFAHKNVKIYDNIASGSDGAYGFVHAYFTGGEIYNNSLENFESNLIIGANESYENPYKLSIDNDLSKKITQMFFKVKYKANGGQGKMETTTVNYGTATKISKNKFTRKGYNFIGWKARRGYRDDYLCDCNGMNCWLTLKEKKAQKVPFKLYDDEPIVVRTLYRHKESVELYAQWKKIKSISIYKMPTKLNYYQSNTTLDLTDGLVKLNYTDKTSEIIDMKRVYVVPFDSSKTGPKKVTISYAGVRTKMKINILPIEVSSITIDTLPNKMTYLVGDKFDITGLVIKAINNDESVVVTDKDYVYKTPLLEKAGVEDVEVTYGGKTISFQIQVKEVEKAEKYNSKNVKVLTNEEIKNTKDNKHDDPLLLELIITLVLMLAYLIFKKVGIKEKP